MGHGPLGRGPGGQVVPQNLVQGDNLIGPRQAQQIPMLCLRHQGDDGRFAKGAGSQTQIDVFGVAEVGNDIPRLGDPQALKHFRIGR